MQSQHPGWKDLLAWLAGHGMDASHGVRVDARATPYGYGMFASSEVPPSTPLFTIPAAALLNSMTLSRHYPKAKAKPKLSNVQLTSLHLLLHRPSPPRPSLDPIFGPYISVLPIDFNTHPLVWSRKCCRSSSGSWLLNRLPPFVKRDLERVAKTFQADWDRVQSYAQSVPGILSTATNPNSNSILSDPDSAEDDYLWAWLNVNTRCIYYRIKESKSDPDNFTLCPILDFANHSSVEASMVPRDPSGDIWDMSPLKQSLKDLTLLSPSEKVTLPGDELHLRYGYHSNQFLFTEYGFVGELSGTSDVDITPVIEDLFHKRGRIGEWAEDRLVEEGYWGEWTLHASPALAYPSYRLITALRLYRALPLGFTDPEDIVDSEALLDVWRQTVNGYRESVSDENETLWKETLHQICESVVAVATTQVATILSESAAHKEASVDAIVACVVSLWNEEKFVANEIIKSLREGASF